jgi:hypothetical protein
MPADDDTPKSDEEPVESDQSSAQVDDSATDSDQPTEQPDEQPAEGDQPEEQSNEESSEKSTDATEQAPERPDRPTDETAEQADESSGGSDALAGEAPAKGELSAKRQSMLDLIDKWMPTSLNNPRVPEGETQDLLATAGWTKARGQQSKQEKDAGGHPVTSCGDILAAMLRLWGSNFVGAFMIRDQDAKGRTPGAKGLGYYVEADGTQSPQPGDIIVLRNGVGKSSAGSVGHVGILVEAGETEWRTADGGGGALPDQTASVTNRTVRFENNIPILKSPTDLKEKELDGWVDLDKLEQSG